MRSLLFTLLLISSTSVQAQTKVGYTNVELIMYYMPEAISASEALEEYKKIKLQQFDQKRERFSELIETYQEKARQASFSGSSEETELITSISILENEINQREKNFESDVSEKQNELLQPVLNKIQAAIDAVAEENGYTYILNQTSGTNILYGVKQFDITDEIAEKLGIEVPD